jgi:hypothetical protein
MAVCTAVLGFVAGPGGAATGVSGSYAGMEHWEPDTSCGLARDFTDATGTIAPFGASSLTLQVCVTGTFTIGSGTPFTLTAGGGAISGHVRSGSLRLTPPTASFTLAVMIDSGTDAFAGATGALAISGTANSAFGPPDTNVAANGDISGNVTIPNPVPATKAQYKHGGWRNSRSDQGQPFKNQGQCVSFVVHHDRRHS